MSGGNTASAAAAIGSAAATGTQAGVALQGGQENPTIGTAAIDVGGRTGWDIISKVITDVEAIGRAGWRLGSTKGPELLALLRAAVETKNDDQTAPAAPGFQRSDLGFLETKVDAMNAKLEAVINSQAAMKASYAQVAASALPHRQTPATQLPQATVTQINKSTGRSPKITLLVSHLDNEHAFRSMSLAGIKSAIGATLEKEQWNCNLVAARRQPSGDVALTLSTVEQADKLLASGSAEWIRESFPSLDALPILRRPQMLATHSIVVHGVPVRGEDGVEGEEAVKDKLREDFGEENEVEVTKMRWLVGQERREGRTFSSAILQLGSTDQAAKLLDQQGAKLRHRKLAVEHYLPAMASKFKHCTNCQRYQHVGRECLAQAACAFCAGNHHTDKHPACPRCGEVSGCAHRSLRCVNCNGEHEANCNICPVRIAARADFRAEQELRKRRVAWPPMYNCHRSAQVMESLLNDTSTQQADVLLLQEPYTERNNPVQHRWWKHHGESGRIGPDNTDLPRQTPFPRYPRTAIYTNNATIPPTSVTRTGILHPDIISIAITRGGRTATVTSVYNPPSSTDTIALLELLAQRAVPQGPHIVAGDFNCHHPMWQDGSSIEERAVALLSVTTAAGLHLLTPRNLPTFTSHQHTNTTIDLVFATAGLNLRSCELGQDHGSDHQPVVTLLDWPDGREDERPRPRNLKRANADVLDTAFWEAWARQGREEGDFEEDSGLDRVAESLQAAIQEAAQAAAPECRPSAYSKPWWSQQLDWRRAAMRRARRRWQEERTEEAREAYNRLRNGYTGAIRKMKKAHFQETFNTAGPDGMWRLAAMSKTSTNAANVAPLRGHDGELQTSDPGREGIFLREFFPLREDDEEDSDEASEHGTSLARPGPARQQLWTPLTAAETSARISLAKPDTAPGEDGITWRALQLLNREDGRFASLLTKFFNACLARGYEPSSLKVAVVVPLRKPGKDDYAMPASYRPILLLPTIGKLLEALVARRIMWLAEGTDLLTDRHYGGRPKRSTTDALVQLQHFLQDARRNKKDVILCALDVKGAYNDVRDNQHLQHELERLGLPANIVQFIRSFIRNRCIRFRLGGRLQERRYRDVGLPQGSPLSQLVFLVHSRGMVDVTGPPSKVLSIGWVDDKTLAVAAKPARLRDMTERLLEKAAQWARAAGAVFDANKSAFMHIRASEQTEPVRTLQVGSLTIKQQQSLKILGVVFDIEGSFQEHLERVTVKGTKALGLLQWGTRTWGFRYSVMRTLFVAGVLPVISYASSIWCPRLSKAMLRPLEQIQRTAGRWITGAYRSTATASLDFEACLLPVQLALDQQQGRDLLRWMTLPETHPLSPLLDRVRRVTPTRHQGPMHIIGDRHAWIQDLDLRRLSKPAAPWEEGPTVDIQKDKDTARQHHDSATLLHDSDEQIYYADGSQDGTRTGAAVVLWAHDARQWAKVGDLGEDATVFRAEVTGILWALEHATAQRITVFTDSQAAALAIRGRGGDSDIRRCQELTRQHRQAGRKVIIRWLPGHRGIPGNEEADRLAKGAILFRGRTLDDDIERARDEEQVDRAAAVQKLRGRIMREWQWRWDKTKAGRRHRALNRLAVGQAKKLYSDMSRGQASLICQFRTGHIGLETYLQWRRVPEHTGFCRCGLRETRQHVVLTCQRWRQEREQLRRAVGRRATSLQALVNNAQAAKHLAAFLAGRFPQYRRA